MPTSTRINPELIVAAPDVLHQRVTTHDRSCRVVAFESPHRSEPGFEPPVIALDAHIRVLLPESLERRARDCRNRTGAAKAHLATFTADPCPTPMQQSPQTRPFGGSGHGRSCVHGEHPPRPPRTRYRRARSSARRPRVHRTRPNDLTAKRGPQLGPARHGSVNATVPTNSALQLARRTSRATNSAGST